jgi:dTDP-glucose 4,6-dehydratase
MKVLVTGGCGFIGSNFIEYLLGDTENNGVDLVVNVDSMTYAGRGKNLEHLNLTKSPKYRFEQVDISDKEAINKIFANYLPDMVFNFAAESHVDRSIDSSEDFVNTNVVGTVNLLEAAKKFNIKKFIQISTDEVYGSASNTSFDENATLNPSSPYSASKAAAEYFAMAYFKTHNLPVIITRSANNYGPYQFPEKLLPLFITNLIDGKKVPLMWTKENPGLNVRDWLHVSDNCRAIWFISQKGINGEAYNIPGENERTNTEMTHMLLSYFNFGDEMIERVPHRLGHDFKYSILGDKLKGLGFIYEHKDLKEEITKLCNWYKDNSSWWRPLKK